MTDVGAELQKSERIKQECSGILRILDEKGKEIGRWDKDGVKIYSGEINVPVIIAGGTKGAAGLIKILNESGNLIGSWGKNGLNVHSGGWQN